MPVPRPMDVVQSGFFHSMSWRAGTFSCSKLSFVSAHPTVMLAQRLRSGSNCRPGGNSMKRLRWTGVLLVGIACAIPPVTVAGASPMRTCLNNVRIICAGVQPGQGRIGSCIQGHFSQLSLSCQVKLAKAATAGKACLADFKALCPKIKPGGGRLEACARNRLPEASQGCQKAVARSAFGGRIYACASDAALKPTSARSRRKSAEISRAVSPSACPAPECPAIGVRDEPLGLKLLEN